MVIFPAAAEEKEEYAELGSIAPNYGLFFVRRNNVFGLFGRATGFTLRVHRSSLVTCFSSFPISFSDS
jgi:hypothetical protein